jgi:hypothetical protein
MFFSYSRDIFPSVCARAQNQGQFATVQAYLCSCLVVGKLGHVGGAMWG